jgi:hypothetical protein
VGVSGESRSEDANGQYIRVQPGGGTNTVVVPNAAAGTSEQQVGVVPLDMLGSMPDIDSSAKTPFRPDVACETQEPPDLNAGEVGPTFTPASSGDAAPATDPQLDELMELAEEGDRNDVQGEVEELFPAGLGLLGGAE